LSVQIAAISEQSSESSNRSGDGSGGSSDWRSFDMHSIVAATEDLFNFTLSRKGWRVRVFLVQDIVKASDAFLQEATFPYLFDKEFEMGEINPEVGVFYDFPECCTQHFFLAGQ
jgi:aarF domain-containing kinase